MAAMTEMVVPTEAEAEAVADVVRLRKIGNSLGIILSKEVLARFGLAESDRFTVVRHRTARSSSCPMTIGMLAQWLRDHLAQPRRSR
jgi:hypothetical protein